MKYPSPSRLIIAVIVLLLLTGILALALNAFDVLFSLWERLQVASPVLANFYAFFLVLFFAAGIVLVVWLLLPGKSRPSARANSAPSENTLRGDLSRHIEQGIDVSKANEEMQVLEQRRSAGQVYVAIYGEISSGKSSLIAALIPGSEIAIDVRGGTTQSVKHYQWSADSGDQIILADVPGLNEVGNPAAQDCAREEALRAHVVIYVCDGDLTRDQWAEIQRLVEFNKPLIVALNKADRYSDSDLQRIKDQIRQRFTVVNQVDVISVQSGGQEEIVEVSASGQERARQRPRPAKIDSLVNALQKQISLQGDQLNALRDTAVFRLAAGKLDQAVSEHRQKSAKKLVDKYTRRAVVGAMAAITPGSDLVIQGALATKFVRDACALYEVPVRQIEIDELLKSATHRIKGSSALVLAISGNAFKAFPGIGTVTGGLMHAVAYGLLFDTLGKSLVTTLHTRGELATEPTLNAMEVSLSEDLAVRAGRIAKIALEARSK